MICLKPFFSLIVFTTGIDLKQISTAFLILIEYQLTMLYHNGSAAFSFVERKYSFLRFFIKVDDRHEELTKLEPKVKSFLSAIKNGGTNVRFDILTREIFIERSY